jgi:hypothetical protein
VCRYFIAIYYTSSSAHGREVFYDAMVKLHGFISLLWVLIGDYDYSSQSENFGGKFYLTRARKFRASIDKCDLLDSCLYIYINSSVVFLY